MDDPRFEGTLEERFQRLRSEEAGRAPDFDTVFDEARRRAESERGIRRFTRDRRPRRPLRWVTAAATLAAAALAAVYLGSPDPEERFEGLVASYQEELGGGRWRSPTDGLLEVPGMDLLATVPSIGGLPGGGTGDGVVPREGSEG